MSALPRSERHLTPRAKLLKHAAQLFWSPKRQTPDQWGAENRTYSEQTGWPGRRDPTLTPYMIEFERQFSNAKYRRVVLATSAQTGKTEAFLDIIGERLDNRPMPIIYVGPSKEF
jgi:phage terminase large subunit GpA-like protein